MSNIKVLFVAIGVVGGLLLLASGPTSVQAAEKVFYIMAMEVKGSASVDKEPFPRETLPTGGGFEIKEPDENGRWKVESYIFSPAQIIVRKGDQVTLHFVGINAAQHLVTIKRYHPKRFSIRRGRLATVRFAANRAGRFQIKCFEHPPSMTGELIVLDR